MLLSIFVVVCSFNDFSFAWGRHGHEMVTAVAISVLPDSNLSRFLKANFKNMTEMSVVPDSVWKNSKIKLENTTHFFNMDLFMTKPPIPTDFQILVQNFGIDMILKNGTVPYRARQMAWLLLSAMKSKPTVNPVLAVQFMGLMSHYYGDLSNPLHLCTDFDGRNAGVPGLHSFFETKSVDNIQKEVLFAETLARARARYKSLPQNMNPFKGCMWLGHYSWPKSKGLLAMAARLKLTPELMEASKPLIFDTLSRSSAILAKLWLMAWELAGQPQLPEITINPMPVPAWIYPDYLKVNPF